LVISFLIPAFDYTYDVISAKPPVITPVDESKLFETPTLSKVIEVDVDYSHEEPVVTTKNDNTLMIRLDTLWLVLFCIYVLVVVLLVVRNIMVHKNLYTIIKQGKMTKYENHKVIDTPVVNMPFTAFSMIFADMSKISEDTVKSSILKHEIVHIRQRHWIDLIFAELALMLQWFNPIMWMYIRSLKENHEFLADKGVLEQGISPDTYRSVLINERLQSNVFNLSSPFKGTGTLGRLSMMKKDKTPAWKKILSLTIIPLLGVFLWVSAEPNYLLLNLDNFSVSMIGKIITVDKDGYPIEGEFSSRDVLHLSKMASYEGAIPESLRNKKIDLYAKKGTNGTLVIDTKQNAKGISSREIIDRINSLADVIILIDGKSSHSDDLNSLSIDNIASLSYLVNNRMLSVEGNMITGSIISPNPGVKLPKLIKTDNIDIALCSDIPAILERLNNPAITIKGASGNAAELKKTKLTNVNIMSVFTKPENTKKYGERAKNGIIIIR